MDELTENASTSTRSRSTRIPQELADEVDTPGNIFVLSEEETRARLFHLRYSAKEDVYYRYGSEDPAVKGWNEGAFTAVNMQRYHAKKGPDRGEWTYLTRKRRHSSGSISWFIDLGQSGLVVDQVYALTYSRTLSGGTISYDLRRPDCPTSKESTIGSHINGLIFVAYLDGGLHKHERAQTQLFFQDCLGDPEGFPFDLLITLQPSDPQEVITNNRKAEAGPLPRLSFPPKPHVVPHSPPRCTCLRDRRGHDDTTSASVDHFKDETRCYAQDEGDIIDSERSENSRMERPGNSRMGLRPLRGVNTYAVTKDVNGNGSVLLPGLYGPMRDVEGPMRDVEGPMRGVEATPAYARRGKVTSIKGPYTGGRTGLEPGVDTSLPRTERYSEPSKGPGDGLARRSSVASTAWERQGIDQETLVESRRQSRCVIL